MSERQQRALPASEVAAVARSRRRRRDRVAVATWSGATESRIGLSIQLEWDRVSRAHPGLAPVSIIGFALATALRENPAANRRVSFWRVRENPTVRISFAVDAANDLRIAVVDRADELSPRELQRALQTAARTARAGAGPLSTATRLIEILPVPIGRVGLRGWSAMSAGLGIGAFGIPGAPFGAALISSVARFGLPAVDVPFVPFTRCALVCSVGAVAPAVIVREGAPAVVDVVEIRVSYDHRICDAGQLAQLLNRFVASCYESPEGGPSPTL